MEEGCPNVWHPIVPLAYRLHMEVGASTEEVVEGGGEGGGGG